MNKNLSINCSAFFFFFFIKGSNISIKINKHRRMKDEELVTRNSFIFSYFLYDWSRISNSYYHLRGNGPWTVDETIVKTWTDPFRALANFLPVDYRELFPCFFSRAWTKRGIVFGGGRRLRNEIEAGYFARIGGGFSFSRIMSFAVWN